MLGINYWATQGHEHAHLQINKYFGASSTININVDVLQGISGVTSIDENSEFYSEEDRRTAYLAHSINESIGYQLKLTFVSLKFTFCTDTMSPETLENKS